MTIDELLKEAAKIKWWRTELGTIRNKNCHCPLVAVANRRARRRDRFHMSDWPEAAKYLGIVKRDADKIVVAADNMTPMREFDSRLRREMERMLLGQS